MARLKQSLRTWQALSWSQRRLFIQAWLLLPLTAAGLRLFGFRRVQAVLQRPASTVGREDLPAAQAIARIVRGASGWTPGHASCLTQSLVLSRLLHRQGLAADLHIGVGKPEGRFAAHAWIEHQGVALAEAQTIHERYAAFDEAQLMRGA